MKYWTKFTTRCLSALLVMFALGAEAHGNCLSPPGDVDGSGLTNVVDTQCTLLVVLWGLAGQTTPLPPCVALGDFTRADVNCDSSVNVLDVQILINYALNAPLPVLIDSDGDQCPDACQALTCGDGLCTAGEDCQSCPADCGACESGCCEGDGSSAPGCGDAGCQACVCGQDNFCCESAWDELCAELAGTVCLGQCPCPPAGALSCAGVVQCSLQCTTPECIAVCQAASTPAATALLACGQAAGCLAAATPEAVDTCLLTNCSLEAYVCFGGTAPADCCDAGPNAGCGNTTCESCVCGFDNFCCNFGWDGQCAQLAAGLCAGACNCQGGEATCLNVTDCLLGCETGACDDTCYEVGQPGTQLPATSLTNCLVQSGCSILTSQEAFDECLVENCLGEFFDCADYVSPFPLDCCDVQPTATCGDATCEGCVCGADAFCCDVSWDSFCTQATATVCQSACGCTPGTAECVPVVNCALGCSNDFCVDQCMSFAAPEEFGVSYDLYICIRDTGCIDLTGEAFTACINTNCTALLSTCLGNAGDCCAPSDSPGCETPSCETCVCAEDSFCCDTAWDSLCAQAAAGTCQASCGCAAVPTADCLDTVNCWLSCPSQACADQCLDDAAPSSLVLAENLLICLSVNGCLAAPTQAQFNACLSANCGDSANACLAD